MTINIKKLILIHGEVSLRIGFLLVQELEQNVSSNETRVSLDDWRKIRWNRLKAKNCREQQLLD